VTTIALTLTLLALQPFQGAIADPNDSTLKSALSQLQLQPTLYLQLNGSTTYRDKVTPFVTNLYWSNSTVGTTPTLQVDIESYVNNVLVKRIVGDGDTLWSYDLSMHQYSATSYGGTPGYVRPSTYSTDLLNDLNLLASGNDGYLTKLLRQIYTTGTPTVLNPTSPIANYTSWMPGVPSSQLIQGVPVTDPVNSSVTYYPSASDDYYAYNASPKRTIVFEIAPGVTANSSNQMVSGLENIYFNQLETINRNSRLVQWIITPYTGFTFSTNLFVPYSGRDLQGWRMVVGPKPVTH
jgi:hypothetical protein